MSRAQKLFFWFFHYVQNHYLLPNFVTTFFSSAACEHEINGSRNEISTYK